MPLVSLRDLHVGIRTPALLDGVSCQIDPGERIGLLGRNGAGKTTLLRILARELAPDGGEVAFAPGAKVAALPQDVPDGLAGTVAEIVAAGTDPAAPEWQTRARTERLYQELGLDPAATFEQLSSGMKRRVLLARALAAAPDLLLLDEPTNHLDVESIEKLEDFLQRWPGAVAFVTHDRYFLRRLAKRIVEIDRGRLFDWSCDYDTFIGRKEDLLAAEERQAALFDKKLAVEEAWLRQGVKARRTRNEGRVRALEAMRRARGQRRTGEGQARLTLEEGQRSGTLVCAAENVSFGYGDRPVFRGFSTLVTRGDKVGIVGPNGAGKTTLLRVLLGELAPQAGAVKLGTNLKVAYFDQLRRQLNDEETVKENVCPNGDTVRPGGAPRHVMGYLQDFLFAPDRARTPVKFLSGGERNRVLLARLFAQPANVVVLDEPTNDLDAETLELLEELLVAYQGTALFVSHDRAFLNHVCTSVIAFEPGGVKEYDGGYDDWVRQRPAAPTAPPEKTPPPAPRAAAVRKRSYKERQELAGLPAAIERHESALAAAHAAAAAPDYFKRPAARLAADRAAQTRTEADLAAAYARWEELEALPE